MTDHLINTSRRIVLRTAAQSAGVALALASPLARAALGEHSTVDVTEGPYFVDERLNRSDIRADPVTGVVKDGLLLLLSINVSTLDTTTGVTRPLSGAYVDLWHCDAAGLYSDESANNTVGQKFLRGYQVSDKQGKVQFRTIYPGWYSGRSPHIHCKVRQYSSSGTQTSTLTTQFFFDEQLTQLVYTDSLLPYVSHGLPDQPHSTDQVYTGNNSCIPGALAGDALVLKVARTAKYASAHFDILIDESARCASQETGNTGGAGGSTPPTGTPPGGTPPSFPTPSTT